MLNSNALKLEVACINKQRNGVVCHNLMWQCIETWWQTWWTENWAVMTRTSRGYRSSSNRGNPVCYSLDVLEVTRDQICPRLKWVSGRSFLLSRELYISIFRGPFASFEIQGAPCKMLIWWLNNLIVGLQFKDRAVKNVNEIDRIDCKL